MIILQALYFFLPAYFANMSPVFASRLLGNRFLAPIDFNITFRGKRIFGAHKTWRGLIFGIIGAIVIIYLQKYLYNVDFLKSISLFNYSQQNLVALGFLLGFGALFGDAVKSFFKRQIGIKPGGRWPIFDQLDFVIGGLLFSALIYIPSWQQILIIIIFTPALHLLSNYIAFKLKWKKHPW